MTLETGLQFAGLAHLVSLSAMVLAPLRLGWSRELAKLPRLVRQMCQVYSGYTTGTIVACGLVSLGCAGELSRGTPLARAVCGYIAVFWAVRLGLQAYYDSKPYLTTPLIRLGYHLLTVLFVAFVLLYGAVAFGYRD